jgi:2-phospho-L-lactate guanylyltransferase
MSIAAILPVKSFDDAKQRLSDGVSSAIRRALAEAMFSDVLTALRRSRSIEQIFVISSDRQAPMIAAGHGATVLEDSSSGHSDAAMIGIRRALSEGAERALLVPGDCPLLDANQIDELIAYPVTAPSALIIPDRHGTGTNGLLLTPPDALTPSFGEGSCARHFELALSQGTTPEVVSVQSLALDIDTPDDLDTLRAVFGSTRGGAAYTRGMLNRMMRIGA